MLGVSEDVQLAKETVKVRELGGGDWRNVLVACSVERVQIF